MATKLFVGCLPYSRGEADILPVFAQYGTVQEVAVLKKGAAFVTFTTADSAEQAMTYLQGYIFEGSPRGINISYATSGGGGGGGFARQPPPPAGPAPGKGWASQPQVVPPPPVTAYPYQAAQTTDASQVAPGSKLFVGQLPYSRSEDDLWTLFGSIGPVAEVVLLKNPQTQEKKGAAFVRYQTAEAAAEAMAALDGFVFEGATRPISVSMATGGDRMGSMGTPAHQVKRSFGTMNGSIYTQAAASPNMGGQVDETKLFVGQLPFSRSEQDIQELFGGYGQVAEVMLHRDAQGQKKGAAFVRFFQAECAAHALELDGYFFPGSTRAICVNYAGAKRQRFN